MTASDAATAVDDVTYEDLYARWERSPWSAADIDFSADRRHWHEEMDEHERRRALWSYSMFFHGEHHVASTLGPFIDAAPLDEQKFFLTTQQVDEARHTVMFARFMREVVHAGDSTRTAMDATAPALTYGFNRTFGRLERLAGELRRDPSPQRLAGGVMLYHMLVEASMAQPGQRMIEGYLERTGLLPGFLEGMLSVSRDEQRHIGFGVKLLSDLRHVPGCTEAAAAMLREVLPWSGSAYVPPDWDETYVTVFGYTLEEVFGLGLSSLDTKLKSAGMPPESLFGAYPLRTDLSPEERARRWVVMLKANLAGEKRGPAGRDPEAVGYLFETVAGAVDPRHAPDAPVTLEWDFSDFGPWHLRVEDGRGEAHPGPAPKADLVFRCTWQDWVDVAAGRREPLRALLTGRLRPRGDLRVLRRFQKMFGG